ncbi:MAG: hypothetical protein CBD02_04610 [Candidatus Pelagibacter sp. TMED142]|nr:MAG: hypothetical protein CBD02_04610 [Candidatus Pelagibacter sp. TMED142]
MPAVSIHAADCEAVEVVKVNKDVARRRGAVKIDAVLVQLGAAAKRLERRTVLANFDICQLRQRHAGIFDHDPLIKRASRNVQRGV